MRKIEILLYFIIIVSLVVCCGCAIYLVQLIEEPVKVVERVETEEIYVPTMTIAERDLVERVVAGEARGESKEGMLAVAQTIKDRANLWGMSIEDVCNQPAQFYTGYDGAISYDVREAVSLVFDFGARVSEEPITHFYNYTMISEPCWVKDKECIATIGQHRFYY